MSMNEGEVLNATMSRIDPLFSREKIDRILATVPREARCCYTGQSILAYCPDPTFSWEEVNSWTDTTDVDIFCYNQPCLASVTQAFVDAGWTPLPDGVDQFKADRIRFYEATKKYKLQTVALCMPGMPNVNLTWYIESTSAVATVARFDMDYLMVGMDIHTGAFVDLRGKNHRVANVNMLNAKFDVTDVDIMYWLRQFDRIPKGYGRGIDTRPVARTYLAWLEEVIQHGDRGLGSKTRYYADRQMARSIEIVEAAGFTRAQAEAMYHLFRHEDNTWEAMKMNLEAMHRTITEWLASVEED